MQKPFENIEGKVENAGNQHFLLFPQYFTLLKTKIIILANFILVVCKCFQFGQVWCFVFCKRVNAWPHNPEFGWLQGRQLVKTLREKVKNQVTLIDITRAVTKFDFISSVLWQKLVHLTTLRKLLSLMTALGVKENMLEPVFPPFSHNVSCLLLNNKKKIKYVSQVYFLVCKYFQFG